MAVYKKTFQFGQHNVTLETGEIARQATSAVMVSMGDTVVLVTLVASTKPSEGDFFPLTIDYQERSYAAGRIPGSFHKREGRPSEKETLTSRLIDRPLRPLFEEDFTNEVQIVATVLSLDPDIDPDIPSMIGASASVCFAGLPFKGPLGAARVGYKNGEYLLNPTASQLTKSDLDLVVAGTQNAVLMVESEAKELPEAVMLEAVMFGHQHLQTVIRAIAEMTAEINPAPWVWQPAVKDEALQQAVKAAGAVDIAQAYNIHEKLARQQRVAEIRKAIVEKLVVGDAPTWTEAQVLAEVEKLESSTVRDSVIAGNPRIDGRDTKTIRPITVRTGVLPRTHGSALFTRGETQALVVATLGSERDSQVVDALEGERKENFMLHYNFPPYCVGEIGRIGSPKRREIGHGRLAKRGVQPIMPADTQFPYAIRVVSEITESNGSSSMASVCGSSLALMDAGVPIKAPVAGIAMGLVKEGDKFVVLSDIMGDEDHLGDMDFKVAGTSEGVTALQMDIKIDGITREIMDTALKQALEGRLHILSIMNRELSQSRGEMSKHAPRITTFRIKPDKIREVIGKGGATIRSITEETGATVDISDDGVVKIAAVGLESSNEARRRIEQIVAEVEEGTIYEGKVVKIVEFGAFVSILPGKEGLVHISQIANERIKAVTDRLQEGQIVRVKVLEIDKQGKIRLSMKDVPPAA